ncbi:hypothetical protein AOQ84DRAFT_331199 [Glonium stellatum]|uniref:C2H2-type domain-containing protein n=1 Tax=Glonium stellatum TaxID=574774 RepID=A0A8E2FDB1_9PEZI|nr:hypothetical protein AOQ84DRAFT_331199 [Glonium stellatum]
MPGCSCGSKFATAHALSQHQRAKKHHFCNQCNRIFATLSGLKQHKVALHSWACGSCNEKFSTSQMLGRHQRATGHCYCRDCNRAFVSNDALRQHLLSSLHASQFHCCDCDRDFINQTALEQHLANKVHRPVRRRTHNRACMECDREFKTEQALEQHRASLVHRPLSDIKCVGRKGGRKGCQRSFSSPSALLHHLESGACCSGVTRQKLTAAIQRYDIDRIISTSSGVTTPTTDSDGGVVFTPLSSSSWSGLLSSPILTPRSSRSGSPALSRPMPLSMTCPLCPATRHRFRTLESLQQHLYSPAHAPQIFHCPISFFPAFSNMYIRDDSSGMRKSFSTLSGLAQHLESGACEGGMVTLRKAAEYIESRLRSMGMKKINLLI